MVWSSGKEALVVVCPVPQDVQSTTLSLLFQKWQTFLRKQHPSPSTTHLSGFLLSFGSNILCQLLICHIFEEECFNIYYLCGGEVCVYHGLLEVKGQLAAASSFLLPRVSWELSSGRQAWWQAPHAISGSPRNVFKIVSHIFS